MIDTVDIACRKFQKEIRAGTTALRVLAALDVSAEPLYNAQIIQRLTAADSELIGATSLHHALRALEGQGLATSHIEPSPRGPARRYYSITPAGHRALTAWKALWRQTKDSVDASLSCTRKDR